MSTKIAKNIKQALELGQYNCVCVLNNTPTAFHVSIQPFFAKKDGVEMAFQKRDYVSKHLPALIYDAVEFHVQRLKFPFALVTFKQNGNEVKEWDFGEKELNEFFKNYQDVVKFGLRTDNIQHFNNHDLAFIFERVFKKKVIFPNV